MTTATPLQDAPTIRCPGCSLLMFDRSDRRHCPRCRFFLGNPPARLSRPAALDTEPASSEQPALKELISYRLRRIRQIKGMLQREVAKEMDIPRTYISKVERGEVLPYLAQVERLAAAIGVTTAQLLDDRISARFVALATMRGEEKLGPICEIIAEWLPRSDEGKRLLLLQLVYDFCKKRHLSFSDYTALEGSQDPQRIFAGRRRAAARKSAASSRA